jgi:outer membrane protein OmpA-like peptidoglycan-associated protein
MQKQSHWLFESPSVLDVTPKPYTSEYFNSGLSTEWEFHEASSYALEEEEWEQSPSGRTIRETISGFSRYSNTIPPQERAKIARIAQMIVQSYSSGQPIRTVRLVGHADRDVQRGASFEKKISGDRALAVQKTLIAAIKNPLIASQISWQRVSAGASQLIVRNPRAEGDRLRNRRVRIVLYSSPAINPNLSALIRWCQNCLNKVLGLRLTVNGLMGQETKSAIGTFQGQRGLAVNGIPTPQTITTLAQVCGTEPPFGCTVGESGLCVSVGCQGVCRQKGVGQPCVCEPRPNPKSGCKLEITPLGWRCRNTGDCFRCEIDNSTNPPTCICR